MTWAQLSAIFREIVRTGGGPSKSGSGDLSITFTSEGEITVSLGTYDISWWNSHTNLGPFSSEEQALLATQQKLEEAKIATLHFLEEKND